MWCLEAQLCNVSLCKYLVAGSSAAGFLSLIPLHPVLFCAPAALPEELGLWGVVGAAGAGQTTSGTSSQPGGRLGRDPSPLPRSTRNSGLCLAVGWRRCSGMASTFNSFGPVQTYMMGRVWAHSHALLALPFPLHPLQAGFAAGFGSGGFGVLGASPSVAWGTVNSSRGSSPL